MAIAPDAAPVPAARSPFDFPDLWVPFFLPSPSPSPSPSPADDAAAEEDDEEDDDDGDDPAVDVHSSFFPEDAFDSFDDGSDDRSDSSEDSDRSCDSEDCSVAWTTKSKKHSPHPHAHSHSQSHRKNSSSFHSACDYISFFGALRKGFCSRPLDQRIAVSKTHKPGDKAGGGGGGGGGGEAAQQEQKSVCAASNGGDATAFSGVCKCSAAYTPNLFFKRAYPSGDSDEQDVNAREVGAENKAEKDLTEIDKKFRHETARESVSDIAMVLKFEGKDFSKNSTDEPRLRDDVCKDMAREESGVALVESENCVPRTNSVPSKSGLFENLNLKEVGESPNLIKNSEVQSCRRGSEKGDTRKKSESKPAMADCSNNSSKESNEVLLKVNKLDSQDKKFISLENIAIPLYNDLQGEMLSSSDKLHEAVDVATQQEEKVTLSEVSTNNSKLEDMLLHIYIKEKHQPEMVTKDSKRRAKAKKVKASKGKKLHLFRDGFTLPAATEPAEDAESGPSIVDKHSEQNNRVQALKTVVKNQVLKKVLSTSATEDDIQQPVINDIENITHAPRPVPGKDVELVDGVPFRDSAGPVATQEFIKAQVGISISKDSDKSGVVSSGPVSKGVLSSSVSYQNIENGDASMIAVTEDPRAAQPLPEAQISGFSGDYSLRTVITSVPPSPQVSSRGWFPRLDAAVHDPVAAPELDTALNDSLSVPGSVVGNSLAISVFKHSSSAISQELDQKSERFQGNLASSGKVDYSASYSSSVEVPSTMYHLGTRVAPRVVVSSSPRISLLDTSNAQYSRFVQVPVSQNLASASNSLSIASLQEEINPPAIFLDDRREPVSTWFQPGTNSGLGFSFPVASTSTAYFGQLIGCNNQTLSMYKQMKSFSIDARYLVNVPSILPGCCNLFLFNIENRQLYGLYVSSSLQAMPSDHEFPVAFDCVENYSLPLSVGELDTILPEAKQMDGRPLFLHSRTVEQLVTMFERKNKSRHSWVPSSANPVSIAGAQGLLELSAVSSESLCTQDRLVEAMGQPYSVISASPISLATNEFAKESWSSLSNGNVPESGQAIDAHGPESQLASARVFSCSTSSSNGGEGAKSIWPEVPLTGFSRKPPNQGVAPSPMALWPHLFPKASTGDIRKESFMHMETREGTSSQNYYASSSELIDMGARPDSESDQGFSSFSESLHRSNSHRSKLAYNPLAVEQGRQKHLLDGPKPSSWSTVGSELDLQQISLYGNLASSQDKKFVGPSSLPPLSEKLNLNIIGRVPNQLSAVPPIELPSHFEMDHALPDSLRDDLGLPKSGTTAAWSEEPNVTPTVDIVPGAVNFEQTDICCYCFIRKADHLIIDCQHLGPCVECAAGKKIEYCGQVNCQTKVTRLLRLFRPV